MCYIDGSLPERRSGQAAAGRVGEASAVIPRRQVVVDACGLVEGDGAFGSVLVQPTTSGSGRVVVDIAAVKAGSGIVDEDTGTIFGCIAVDVAVVKLDRSLEDTAATPSSTSFIVV